MPATYKILIMGASYGSLLASKIMFGGHSVHLVRLPVKGRTHPIEIDYRKLPGKVTAGGAAAVTATAAATGLSAG